ncbi:MAG: hypothetical protein LBI06_08290 [Treponema sp.]|nr:hypothetical protein [Treponema sp.]
MPKNVIWGPVREKKALQGKAFVFLGHPSSTLWGIYFYSAMYETWVMRQILQELLGVGMVFACILATNYFLRRKL